MLASRNINSLEQCQKRYYTFVGYGVSHMDYPDVFVRSRRIKYVHVMNVYVYIKDGDDLLKVNGYSFHASFVQDDIDNLDHYVCLVNEPLYQRRKYEQFNSVKGFDFWIKDVATGAKMTLNSNVKIILELMLEF